MAEEKLDKMLDMDALLDGKLDDLADMPEFKPYPVGAHVIKISWQLKDKEGKKPLVINKHPCIQLNVTGVKTAELPAGSEDQPIKEGDTTNILFMMDNDMGQGQFKNIVRELAAHFQTTSVRETLEKSEGAECLAVFSQRPNKEKTRMFNAIDAIKVL